MIRHLELHHFASHQDTEIEFGSGKNVIIGQTGSGKTNLLLAIDFAFAGEVSEITLSELIADGADAAEVILDYIEPRTGQSYRISRTLTREADGTISHECSLSNLDTNETVQKPSPVQKTLESLGVSPSVFRHVVHVAQGSFADLLKETQDRKNTLDRLLQISQLESAYQELGRQDGPISQIELRRQRNLQKKSALEAGASKLDQERKILERVAEERQQKQMQIDEAIKERNELEKTSGNTLEALTALRANEDQIAKSRATIASSSQQIEPLIAKLGQILPEQDFHKIEQQKSSEIRLYLERLESDMRAQIEESKKHEEICNNALERAALIQSRLTLAEEDRKAILNQVAAIKTYLDGKGEQPQIECDRCGSILTKEQWGKHIKEKQEEATNLEKKTAELLTNRESDKALASQQKVKLEETRANTDSLKTATILTGQILAHRQAMEDASASTIQLQAERERLVGELRLISHAEPVLADQEVVSQALTIRQRLQTLSIQIDDLAGELGRYDEIHLKPQQKRVTDAEEATDQLRRLEPEIITDEKKISLLQTVRSALREIQPAVRRGFVSRITQSANDYLTRLYGGEEIQKFELTEDYEFIVTRAGYKRHAKRLSGGQQVLTSMAFLLALSEVLSQLDFLILDEPTTHLDANRRRELVAVLENLRRVPQLIIVDHHPELLEAADTRFRISLTKEGLSQVDQINEPRFTSS